MGRTASHWLGDVPSHGSGVTKIPQSLDALNIPGRRLDALQHAVAATGPLSTAPSNMHRVHGQTLAEDPDDGAPVLGCPLPSGVVPSWAVGTPRACPMTPPPNIAETSCAASSRAEAGRVRGDSPGALGS